MTINRPIQTMNTDWAFSSISSAICNSSDNSALFAIDLNIRLATSAAPIWSGHVFQKIIAIRMRLKSTAQTNSSRPGWSMFSATHSEHVVEKSLCIASDWMSRAMRLNRVFGSTMFGMPLILDVLRFYSRVFISSYSLFYFLCFMFLCVFYVFAFLCSCILCCFLRNNNNKRWWWWWWYLLSYGCTITIVGVVVRSLCHWCLSNCLRVSVFDFSDPCLPDSK